MSEKTLDSTWLWVAAVTLFVLGAAFAHFSNEFILAYPLDTWRMDLDDAIGNLGTFFVGLAAMLGLRRAYRKIEQNGTKEQVLERREEEDYQHLRAEFEALRAHFEEWDGTTERRTNVRQENDQT